MGKLDKALLYLSGPMEFVQDQGVVWRQKFKKLIGESNLDIDIIDPTQKPGESLSVIAENKIYQEKLQKEGRFEELRDYVHNYRRQDLRFVDFCDAVVAVIDRDVYQCGTLNEVFLAEMQHKPIFTICSGGLYKLPRWMFDVIDFDLLFENVEEVVQKLIEINQQKEELDSRWVLIRKYLQ